MPNKLVGLNYKILLKTYFKNRAVLIFLQTNLISQFLIIESIIKINFHFFCIKKSGFYTYKYSQNLFN